MPIVRLHERRQPHSWIGGWISPASRDRPQTRRTAAQVSPWQLLRRNHPARVMSARGSTSDRFWRLT